MPKCLQTVQIGGQRPDKVVQQFVLPLRVGGKQAVVHRQDTTGERQIRQEPFLTF